MKNRLTDTKLKKFKSEKTKKLYDGDGLFILYIPKRITADERKRWQYRYAFNNKEQLLTLGDYPSIPKVIGITGRRQGREPHEHR